MMLANRVALASLCNTKGIKRAVEVGTDRGVYAEQFLDHWQGEILICVDTWAPYPEMPYDRTADLLMAVTNLARFRGRVKLARGTSVDMATIIGPQYRPGFVYIDAEHQYASVQADLAAWWPMLEHGGILAGHDYMEEHAGVVRAVNEFAALHGAAVQVTENLDEYRSWWLEKRA